MERQPTFTGVTDEAMAYFHYELIMNEKIFELGALEIWKRGNRFFARYDAGAHQV